MKMNWYIVKHVGGSIERIKAYGFYIDGDRAIFQMRGHDFIVYEVEYVEVV